MWYGVRFWLVILKKRLVRSQKPGSAIPYNVAINNFLFDTISFAVFAGRFRLHMGQSTFYKCNRLYIKHTINITVMYTPCRCAHVKCAPKSLNIINGIRAILHSQRPISVSMVFDVQ